MAKTIKTLTGDLNWVYITGEGKNIAGEGKPPKMQFLASIEFDENSEEFKYIKKQIDDVWNEYKTKTGTKGLPASNGIKQIMVDCPDGTIDPKTEEVLKVPSGRVVVNFKTNTTFKINGKVRPKVVDIVTGRGKEITNEVNNADWSIGKGSRGRIYGTAQVYEVKTDAGLTKGVSLYLNAVQLITLVKYTGKVDVDIIDEGEELDLSSATPIPDTAEDDVIDEGEELDLSSATPIPDTAEDDVIDAS